MQQAVSNIAVLINALPTALQKGLAYFADVDRSLTAHSDESGHRFRLKATTCSDPKRPLWPGVGLGGVIVADG